MYIYICVCVCVFVCLYVTITDFTPSAYNLPMFASQHAAILLGC